METIDYIVLFGYFAGMAAIGVWAMKRVKGQEDYFMGGRRFGKLFQTFAAFGAGTGSADPVNTARGTFASGMSGMWGVMYWLFVTPMYWISAVWYRRMRCLTLGDWFVERYQSKQMGVAYAIFGCFYYMVYGAMLFTAIGKVSVPLVGPELFGVQTEYVLVPIVAIVVTLYGVLGGIAAAYWTDLIQGFCIILLSVLLIPFGLHAVVEKFGSPGDSWTDGFRVMHEQLPASNFTILGGDAASEFPLYAIVVIVIMNMIGIALTPHFIVTGGGTAKSEQDARIGLVTGNFIKRFCTIGWVITALIVLTLFGDDMALMKDADMAWGAATKELLGPLGIGLVGLMLACLLAALMSSVDCYMLVCSALVVRNVYVPFVNPKAGEKECLLLGRATGGIVVLGAVIISVTMLDMFKQLELTWVVPMTFAALFWVGMYWRRATTKAGWITVAFCVLSFFVLPRLIPTVAPSLRTEPSLVQSNLKTETGGGKSIYWSGGVEEKQGITTGVGSFRFDMLIYEKIPGVDLTRVSNAALKTLEFPFKIIAPFLVMIIASLLTKPNDKKALDRLYVKMKTPVDPVPEKDEAEIEQSYANPDRFDKNKLFPNSNLEFQRPTKYDVIGFLICFALCFAIIGLVLLVAQIGT
ncbi:MAG: sodium:solute symporter family protein [Opitutae bacterium]|jgi:solute:Na+ symporter, SSS family|nr:sodium:solute symporter family protein [Opitutae bacterium]